MQPTEATTSLSQVFAARFKAAASLRGFDGSRGWIQSLAAHLQVSRTAIYRYMSGKICADATMLVRISNYFNVSIDYLLGKTDQVDAGASANVTYLSIPLVNDETCSIQINKHLVSEKTKDSLSFAMRAQQDFYQDITAGQFLLFSKVPSTLDRRSIYLIEYGAQQQFARLTPRPARKPKYVEVDFGKDQIRTYRWEEIAFSKPNKLQIHILGVAVARLSIEITANQAEMLSPGKE